MWEDLLRVDWGKLTHAYGFAPDAPRILLSLLAPDEEIRTAGWDGLWGSLNHQGDYYDSTVATIPFLIEAVAHPETPERPRLLDYFRTRWLDAPLYGGDPLVPEPPGGVDEPTPLLADAEFAAARQRFMESVAEASGEQAEEECEPDRYRPMDLCAWQTARAIQAARGTFVALLEDPDPEVAASAAALLLLWPETRPAGKRVLHRTIETAADPLTRAKWILESGVYGEPGDLPLLSTWTGAEQPAEVRSAAGLVWAWCLDPEPLPDTAARALRDSSVPTCNAFARLPWIGVWHRGPWILPSNAARFIFRLAENDDQEVRWRAIQGLEQERETRRHLADEAVAPVLIRCLDDPYDRTREAAAAALAQIGERVFDLETSAKFVLLRVLGDPDPSVCGHVARLLATGSGRLSPTERAEALAGVERALERFKDQQRKYVRFNSTWIGVTTVLEQQREALQASGEWTLALLFEEFAFPQRQDRRLSHRECSRRLAEAYTGAPRKTIAAAIQAVGQSERRNLAVGAASWLATVGPAAEPALEALDGMAAGDLDQYARPAAASAAKSIRRSLEIEAESGTTPARARIADLAKLVEAGAGTLDEALLREWDDLLTHPDALVRAEAAALLARAPAYWGHQSELITRLERLLTDDATAAVGVSGRYELDGDLFLWREERHSPRAAAIRALFHLDQFPAGDGLIRAMAAEAMRPAVVCGLSAEPHRFEFWQWQAAVAAAGGLTVADPIIRRAHQGVTRSAGGGVTPHVYASMTELAEVIRRLSGRLV